MKSTLVSSQAESSVFPFHLMMSVGHGAGGSLKLTGEEDAWADFDDEEDEEEEFDEEEYVFDDDDDEEDQFDDEDEDGSDEDQEDDQPDDDSEETDAQW